MHACRSTLEDPTALVSIRPERVRFLGPDEALDNCVEGIVTERVLLGRYTRYIVDALGQRLVVISWEPHLSQQIHVGQSVRLGWARQDAQLLSEPDDAAG